MCDMIDSWIKHHRMLRIDNLDGADDLWRVKRNSILMIYRTALRGRVIPAKPYVYSSHHADIRQIPELNAIICDTHFLDIAQLVASSFYISPTHDITRLADALLANSLLCHGKVTLALKYARRFISGPYDAVLHSLKNDDLLYRIRSSVGLQTSFALLHEIAHFECDNPHNLLVRLFRTRLYEVIDSQNEISQYINALDITAITPYLDKTVFKTAFSYSPPENYIKIILEGHRQILSIISKYGHKVQTPEVSDIERKQLLLWASKNYLLGRRALMLDRETLATEGVCDLLALFELLDYGIPGLERMETLELIIDAYALSLLTLDLIHYAMNALKYAKDNGHKYVDSIYMRREKERLLLPGVMSFHSIAYHNSLSGEEIDILCDHFSDAAETCDVMYTRFCDYASLEDFNEDTFIPHGSPEWFRIYTEINHLLRYPV